jgi:DNA replication ATP-dependent helicase Dna2
LKSNNSENSLTFTVVSHTKSTADGDGIIIGEHPELKKITLTYTSEFQKTFEVVHSSDTIRCLYILQTSDTKNELVVRFSHESILILEPEWLISVSEIVQCVVDNEINTNLYFFEVFTPIKISTSMVFGSLVNAIFDELLLNSNATYSEIFEEFLRTKPLLPALLSNVTIENEPSHYLDILFQKGQEMYDSLSIKTPFLSNNQITLEPQFVSKKYSIVGRLDYMNVYDDVSKIEVIELKSSKAPSFTGNFYFRSIRYPSTMWSSHFIQVVCYQLLLESVFPNVGIAHSILYAAEMENFLRSVPITTTYKRVCLEVRNKIVVSKKEIQAKKFDFHSALLRNELGVIPTYSSAEYQYVQTVYSNCSKLELLYFRSMLFFLENEARASIFQIGQKKKDTKSQSLFFFLDEKEKKKSLYFIDGLSLLNWNANGVMEFEIYHDYETSLRIGDSILVYPQGIRPESLPLLKATIVEINENVLKVQQYFTMSNTFFEKYVQGKWCIESDSTHRSMSSMYSQLLANFLYVNTEKKSTLLGLKSPERRSDEIQFIKEGKTPSQIVAIQQALSCNDYFLIQGPPGTGKTAVVMAEIVKSIIDNTEETILLLAYTNKVVDELCEVVKRLGFASLMVRIGSTTNVEIQPFTLSTICAKVPIQSISTLLKSKRICISTVASIASNPEVLLFWKFHTAIIDEAAQIVEAFCIGIVFFCDRFILIGDEKQLPAIVVQPEEDTVINSKELHSIGLQNLSESLFTRLLCNAKNKNWEHSFAMLKEQGRMHYDIQQLSNTLFYFQQLSTLRPLQQSNEKHFEDSTFLGETFRSTRAIFCDISSQRNRIEEETILLLDTLTREFQLHSPNLSIGIISPFRKFNHRILQHFTQKNVDNIDIDTVERFQGSERDVILFCLPIENVEQLQSIESTAIFDGIAVDRKLNVALTRAKEYFVCCGSSIVLRNSSQYVQLLDLLPNVEWK